MTKLKEELAAPLRVMQEMARRIAKVSQESKLPLVEEEYVQSFKVELMDAVVQWCRGASFSEICKVRLSLPLIYLTTTILNWYFAFDSSQINSREASSACSGVSRSSSVK